MKKIYEGKAKILYATDNKDEIILYFKDDATAGNGEKKGKFYNKGFLNNIISAELFSRISGICPSHFIKKIDDRMQIVKRVEIIPVEVIFRNLAAGTFLKRMPFNQGDDLRKDGKPLIEFCYKNDDYNDPLIGETHILQFGWLSADDLFALKQYTLSLVSKLSEIFNEHGIILVDGKFEFGFDVDNNLVLSDEICPDTLRLWRKNDVGGFESLDKDLFRKSIGGETAAYTEIATLLGLIH